MKIELRKVTEIDGQEFMKFYIDDSCDKCWNVTDNPEKEKEAQDHFFKCKENIRLDRQKTETILEYSFD